MQKRLKNRFLWSRLGMRLQRSTLLFIPQGNHWINARRAARGHKTCQRCHREESKRYHDDSWDIVGLETVEQGGHRSGRDCRQDQANGESGERERQASFAEREQYV